MCGAAVARQRSSASKQNQVAGSPGKPETGSGKKSLNCKQVKKQTEGLWAL